MVRTQSRGEEIANSVSHGVGFVAVLGVLPLLVLNAVRHGPTSVVGAVIFGTSAALLYLTSALYHAIPDPRTKRLFQILDHGAIYILIAGTYTPFMLGVLRGPWGWTLLGSIWTLALFGIVLKARGGIQYPRFSTALYLGMGWLIVIAAKPFLHAVPVPGLLWLAAGGVAYTAGVGFYAASRLPYRHFVWHLFVLAGTACHVVAVLGYSA